MRKLLSGFQQQSVQQQDDEERIANPIDWSVCVRACVCAKSFLSSLRGSRDRCALLRHRYISREHQPGCASILNGQDDLTHSELMADTFGTYKQ